MGGNYIMYKKGVTLLTLALTLAVLAILASAVIINTETILPKAELSTFGEEVKIIEDRVKEYYISNGTLPIKQGSAEYTIAELEMLHSMGFQEELRSEITKNTDVNSKFYVINYYAINVRLEDRGLEQTPDDIYVVSSKSNKVYYVRGVIIKDEIYFSLANIANTTVID